MQLPTADMSDDFSNLILLHDDWLKNMQTAHQDAFRGMVNAIDDLGSRVGACQEKNNQIVDQMNLLDALIEEERVKWKHGVGWVGQCARGARGLARGEH